MLSEWLWLSWAFTTSAGRRRDIIALSSPGSIVNTLLIIGYVWPEPTSSAAGSRMMQLIRFFSLHGYNITFASPAQQTVHMEDLAALGISICAIELNNSSFDEFVRNLTPDTVLFDRFMMEEQFGWRVEKHCPEAIRILNTEDLHSLRDARHQAVKQNREVTDTDLNSEKAIREIAAIHRSDLTLMISSFETDLLQTHYRVPSAQLLNIPFMFNLKDVSENTPDFGERNHFVTIGNFRHQPNWDAALFLHQTIWPLIRQQLPDAELHIYGAYMPPKASQLHNPRNGFLMRDRAENAIATLASSKVLLAPLRFGAGIKGKLTDAMLAGTPSVTTSIGAEAMSKSGSWNGSIQDDPVMFAEAAVSLYNDQELWAEASLSGKQILKENYDENIWHPILKDKLEKLREDIGAHRQQGFTGMMLRHHTMKSTQYMAQWIEAKNRIPE